MTAQRNQEAWDALRRERDSLKAELADRVSPGMVAMLKATIRQATDERDELAQQVEAMRSKVYSATICHPNGVQYLLDEAIALPNTAAEALRQRDARVLREAAADLVAGNLVGGPFISDALLKMADELERKSLRSMTEADFNEAHGG